MARQPFIEGNNESGSVDPIALLEALRRHAGRITLFCQAGCIGAHAAGNCSSATWSPR
jgi:hypothetical protein